MPPRKTPGTPSSAAKAGLGPSPARSTRSASRSVRGGDDDDWENQSVQSHSFKVPNARTGKGGKPGIGLKDTSVNVAAAFHAAQTGHLPTPTSERSFPPPRAKATAKPNGAANGSNGVRAQSPIEQLAKAARATSPVRYFLKSPGAAPEEDSYNSFSSLGSAARSTDTSYDYAQEEEYVRKAQSQANAKSRRVSGMKRANTGDMPYRPAEDDWQPDSDDSGGEGDGRVRGGGLDGRAGTRGVRQEKGEGYLGMGLGIQPRQRRKGGHEGGYAEGDDGDDGVRYRDHTPMPNGLEVQHSPTGSRYRRSTTPVQALARAFSPYNHRSPTPSFAQSRKRQPTATHTVLTNLLHGIAIGLRLVVEVIGALIHSLVIKPIRGLSKNGKGIGRQAMSDWYKWAGCLLLLSLALRWLESPWNRPFAVPDVPPSSMDELVSRLLHLEQAVTLLSDSTKILADAEKEGKLTDEGIMQRVASLESSINTERQRLDGVKGDEQTDVKSLRKSLSSLKTDVGDLTSRVGKGEKGLESANGRVKLLEKDTQALRDRVDEVEKDVKSALDDGRFRSALDRILPKTMPVKVTSRGTLEVDPIFWTEMKKVLAGKSEVDEMIKRNLAESTPVDDGLKERDIEAWGDRLLERKTSEGAILRRAEFIEILEGEIGNLKSIIDALPRHTPSSKSSPSSKVTIKSSKGEDVTSLLQELIDAALLRYSKDTLARPDFALFSAGGRIVPSITSDTLVMRTASKLGKAILGRKDVEGRSPATALHPDNSPGSCWPFKGSQGQLGVLLNRKAVVTDITIEHAAKELALDVSTAPKDIEVWGLVEGEENKAKVQDYLSSRPAEFQHSPEQILFGTFTYDPSAPSHIQTFPVEPEVVNLGIDVGIVIFKIQENWGGDFTCLYRVRVHGDAVAEA